MNTPFSLTPPLRLVVDSTPFDRTVNDQIVESTFVQTLPALNTAVMMIRSLSLYDFLHVRPVAFSVAGGVTKSCVLRQVAGV